MKKYDDYPAKLPNLMIENCRFLCAFLLILIACNLHAQNAPTIRYLVHEQSTGWYPWVSENTTVGIEEKRIEAIKILPFNFPTGATLEYRAHVQSIGWLPWVKAGQLAGTTGQSLRMEAIEIRLNNFPGQSICYWTLCGDREGATLSDPGGPSENCDGRQAGTTGRRRPIEKIRIWLTPN